MKPHKYTAIILAAGMGTRLRSLIGEKPKSFLEIAGISLINRSLTQLRDHGVSEIIIVVGYMKEYFINMVPIKGISIHYVNNENYATTGSMHSLSLLENVISDDRQYILLESDLLYENFALSSLLNANDSNILLTSGFTDSGDEVFVHGHRLVQYISKKKNHDYVISGELVGISKLSPIQIKEMCNYYTKNFYFKSKYDYEICISDIASSNEVNILKIENLKWCEIDDYKHFDRAVHNIYPAILSDSAK